MSLPADLLSPFCEKHCDTHCETTVGIYRKYVLLRLRETNYRWAVSAPAHALWQSLLFKLARVLVFDLVRSTSMKQR